MREIKETDVVFTLTVEQDEIPVRGNAQASGDDADDKAVEDEILRRLDNGDVWAWASVKVSAWFTLPDGTKLEGVDYLGGCSYRDEAEFCRPGGYYDDMKSEALADLQRKIEAQIKRGELLAEMFA